MTYIIVLHGDDERLVANAACMAGVLQDWLLQKLQGWLPDAGSWQLDLCDAEGGLRLVSALPAVCSGLTTLTAGATYRAVARRRQPSAIFRPLGGAPELEARLLRDELSWELAALRLEEGAAPELVLQAVHQVLAAAGSSTASGLARQLARLGRDGRTERLAALEEALGPHGGRLGPQAASRTSKQRTGRSRSTISNRSAESHASSMRASPLHPSPSHR